MAELSDNPALTDPGPGVHVVVQGDPLRAARAIAGTIDGMVIDLPMMAASMVARRVHLPEARAARARLDQLEDAAKGLAGAKYEADRQLIAQRDELTALAERGRIDATTTAHLRGLRSDLAWLESSIRKTGRLVAARHAAALGVDPPDNADDDPSDSPEADKRLLAANLRAAQAAVTDARRSLELLGPGAGPGPATDEPDESDAAKGLAEPAVATASEVEPEPTDEAEPVPADEVSEASEGSEELELWDPARLAGRTHQGDSSVLMPLAIVLFGIFGISVLLLFSVPRVVIYIIGVLVLLLAGVTRYSIKAETRGARAQAADGPGGDGGDGDEADGSTDVGGGPADGASDRAKAPKRKAVRRAVYKPTRPTVDALTRRRVALRDAERRLAEAQGAWDEAAGSDADPDDQAARLDTDTALGDVEPEGVATAPEWRALVATHDRLWQRWTQLWSDHHRTPPPPDEGLVERMLADLHRSGPYPQETQAALGRVADAEHRLAQRDLLKDALDRGELAELREHAPDEDDLDDRPLVLVNPFTDLGQKRRKTLRRNLAQLPDDLTVVIVVASADDVPSAASPAKD